MDIDQIFQSQKETRWVNKQRTLIVSTKGITERANQLMLDIHNLLPHSKKESKLEKGNWDEQIRDLCLLNSCRSFIFFECRKGRALYIWIGRYPNGPTVKYFIENLHNSKDIKLSGNCMKGSRPVLSFDQSFNDDPLLSLQKELFIHAFNVPKHHPKSMPCCDRVFSWMKEEGTSKLWMRQYEIKYDKVGKEVIRNELLEVGPRMILNPICILEGCLSGRQIHKNLSFVKPKKARLDKLKHLKTEMEKRKEKKIKMNETLNLELPDEEIDHIFDGEYVEKKKEQLNFDDFRESKKVTQ